MGVGGIGEACGKEEGEAKEEEVRRTMQKDEKATAKMKADVDDEVEAVLEGQDLLDSGEEQLKPAQIPYNAATSATA